MDVKLSVNNNLYQNKNNLSNVSFSAANGYVNLWKYEGCEDWISKTISHLPRKTGHELMEIYGGPKSASSLEVFAENIKGLFYPITRLCLNTTKLFTKKKCIKVVEYPHKYPYATRKEFYSDGSSKEMQYGASKELINMFEINKDGVPTRSIQYNWGFGDYTIRIYDENRKVTKLYSSVKHPYYSRLGD